MSLNIEETTSQGCWMVRLKGIMDYSTIDGLLLTPPESIHSVRLDLSQLSFIDSTGIGAILSLIYDSSARGITVEFEGLDDSARELFDTVGVFRVLEAVQKRVN